MKVSVGRGCPRGWTGCYKYCISERFFSGFCVRALCCCLPMISSPDHLERFVNQAVQRRMVLVVNDFVDLIFFCFVVAIFDLVHDLEAIFHLPKQHIRIISEIRVKPVKLQSLLFHMSTCC